MADSNEFYTSAQRGVQDAIGTRQLADALQAAIVVDRLDDAHRAFIESRDFFFLSTVSAASEPTVSHKGGGVGTVRVLDDKRLMFPAYDGNGMFLSLGNIVDSAKIGLLFIDFETPNRLRVQATAQLSQAPELLNEYPGALRVVVATIDSVFVNCARYIHHYERVKTSRHVPEADGSQPYATWKRIDQLQPFLPDADQGKATGHGGTLTEAEYAERLARGES
ncbi:MAG: pyridoxamine 5'-phosphate oxidase family protein [Pseudomonadota bacterium]